jgi:rhomboid protease GluP
MAECSRCGNKLPFYSLGKICKSCRETMAHFAAQHGTSVPARQYEDASSWPPFTTALVVINLIVFLAMIFGGVSVSNPNPQDLFRWGANYGPISLSFQPWRLLTANYIHIGIIHIALNMWGLWSLGNLAERIFGGWTYLVIYVLCGLTGSLASAWRNPPILSAGASGAIFGIAGALIAALYLGKLPFPKHAVQSTLKSLLFVAGYNLFYGAVVPGISNSDHIGGFVCGLILGAALAGSLTAARGVREVWRLGVFAVATISLFAAFIFVRSVRGFRFEAGAHIHDFNQGHSVAAKF